MKKKNYLYFVQLNNRKNITTRIKFSPINAQWYFLNLFKNVYKYISVKSLN